jgi:Icc-related predicted phosphoesterase
MEKDSKMVRIAAVADLHCGKTCSSDLAPLLSKISEAADVLLLCGDLTDLGLPEEAQVLSKVLSTIRIPMLGVLGNHDYEGGHQEELAKIFADVGLKILDGEAQEVQGIGFAGAKGFGGGFGRRTLEPWGEPAIKHFVQEALDETLKLESALARLRTHQRVALLHYAPIRATVEGEPPEIFAFLGSSRLEEPLNRYEVAAVFHGHAHHGAPEGKTQNGIPVYNVSHTLLKNHYPDQPPFRLLELPREVAQPVTH